MSKLLLSWAFLVCLIGATPAVAQNPHYDVGPVWRITYYHIKPGMSDAFWRDFHAHSMRIYEEAKQQGLVSDYKAFTNATNEGPLDWDVAIAILYPDWAALDQMDAKAATIAAKHYGSRDASMEAARKRSDFRDVVSSRLVREVFPK